jgi:hypothetical protein
LLLFLDVRLLSRHARGSMIPLTQC